MPDIDLTAMLAAIRENAEYLTLTHSDDDCEPGNACTGHEAIWMANALEALAKPHQPGRNVVLGDVCRRHENHPYFSITALEAADVRACPDCTATVYVSCAGCGPQVSLDACPVRQAIARELTREEASGGER